MFALKPPTTSDPQPRRLTPHMLPCTIRHSGAVSTSSRHWDPQVEHKEKVAASSSDASNVEGKSEGDLTAYLRGRKLLGKKVSLPEGYTGVVLERTDNILPAPPAQHTEGDDEDEEDAKVDVKMLETRATFDEFVVWGHESLPADDDPYVKGVREWMDFAGAVSSDSVVITSSRWTREADELADACVPWTERAANLKPAGKRRSR